jgi:hypothetical protein
MYAKKMTYAKSILIYIFLYTSLYIPELRYIVYRKKKYIPLYWEKNILGLYEFVPRR